MVRHLPDNARGWGPQFGMGPLLLCVPEDREATTSTDDTRSDLHLPGT